MRVPRSRRLGFEAVALVSLGLAVGAGLLLGEVLRPGQARSVEELLAGVNDRGLTCLKDVVETAADRTGPAGPSEGDQGSVEHVARAVEQLRGLRFKEIPEPLYLDPRTLAGRAVDHVDDYAEAQAWSDGQILAALGAVEPHTDIRETTAAAIEGQVAGYYDPETGELVVTQASPGAISPEEEAVLAHELVHALVDQTLGLPSLPEPTGGGEDEHLAAISLGEGDATLAMSLYATDGIFAAAASLPAFAASAMGEPIPYFLQRSFTFPYAEGLGFVCHLYRDGGWAAVDAAYASPPTTTAQVLFPERYRAGEAEASPRDASPSGWASVARRSLGAADLLFLFEAPGNDPRRALEDPLGRVADWGGGAVGLWTRSEDRGVTVLLVQRGRDGRLCASVREWYRAAFPGDRELARGRGEAMVVDGDRQDAVLGCAGAEVRLGIGPDVLAARDLIR